MKTFKTHDSAYCFNKKVIFLKLSHTQDNYKRRYSEIPHYLDAQPSRGTKRRDEEQIMTKQNCHMKSVKHKQKKNCSRVTAFKQLVGKLLGWLKPVSLVPNRTLNSDAAQNYKCTSYKNFLYLNYETSQYSTYNHQHCVDTKLKAQWQSEAKVQENHK